MGYVKLDEYLGTRRPVWQLHRLGIDIGGVSAACQRECTDTKNTSGNCDNPNEKVT